MADVDDVIRVACRQEFQGRDDVVNVMHWAIGTMPTPATDAAIMADLGNIISKIYLEVATWISNEVDIIDLSFYNVTDDQPVGVTSWPGPYSGGASAGEALPAQITAMLLLPTNVKRTIGRIYLPVMTEGAQDAGEWVAGVHTDVDTMGSFLLAPTEGDLFGGFYRYGVLKRSTGILHFPTSMRLASQAATQRRRKVGRGS